MPENDPVNQDTVLNDLRCAALRAISVWADGEKRSAMAIRPPIDIDDSSEVLKKWLTGWGLSKNNPKYVRPKLAEYLNELGPRIEEAQGTCLPRLIQEEIKERRCPGRRKDKEIEGQCPEFRRQPSLLSKFAFSIRPTVAVPYDQNALNALMARYESNGSGSNPGHCYPAYLEAFDRFADECSEKLDEKKLTGQLEPFWRCLMDNDETLFKRRTADKLLWGIGRRKRAELRQWLNIWNED